MDQIRRHQTLTAMFTKCTECQTIQPISVDQLRSGRGMLQCKSCFGIFYALEHIANTAAAVNAQNQADNPLLWDMPESKGHKKYWQAGSLMTFLLLVGQIAYFEGDTLTQNPKTRKWLEKLCQSLHCQLPTYQNLHDFSALQGQLTPLPEGRISFKTAMSNQAPFTQSYPNLKLTLLDFAGNIFAQRIFQPEEYLSKDAATKLLADASAEINITIAEPTKPIGGYTFDLVY